MERNKWVKSTRSGSNGQCVEVRDRVDVVDVRDSKNPGAGTLTFSPEQWTVFVAEAKRGTFDL
ncbi:MAG TPA: DUF397 domain-containing protein [Candidatus Saccharimonadales bacterium]|nr:DUF397 domain-containing protein [Candidatus Saccharimonadales bacterium]